jgi:hypothetical protein
MEHVALINSLLYEQAYGHAQRERDAHRNARRDNLVLTYVELPQPPLHAPAIWIHSVSTIVDGTAYAWWLASRACWRAPHALHLRWRWCAGGGGRHPTNVFIVGSRVIYESNGISKDFIYRSVKMKMHAVRPHTEFKNLKRQVPSFLSL